MWLIPGSLRLAVAYRTRPPVPCDDAAISVSDELAILFLATGLTHGIAAPEGTEDLEIRWLPFADAMAMTLDGRITDAMSVVAIERLTLLQARVVSGGQ